MNVKENFKIYKKNNVFQESLERIRFLYDSFENVFVNMSGGKDSTIIYNLCKIVAREKNRLPLKVLFIDQEAEWQATIDYIKYIMYLDDIEPYWLQVPIKLFNATSINEDWLFCWDLNKKHLWMREKDKISIKKNIYGTDRFKNMFDAFLKHESKGTLATTISGVRVEESPGRRYGCTTSDTFKGITWGAKHNDYNYTFYPIYDWGYVDVWKAIHDNNWKYNKVYDYQYKYGVKINSMRVSNLHHETAIQCLFYLQEVEPQTYQKLTNRISGIDSAGKLNKDYFIKDLPYMFINWQEYKDYLLENLIVDENKRKIFKNKFKNFENRFIGYIDDEKIYKSEIQTILANDWTGTKIDNARKNFDLILRNIKRKQGLL